MDSQFHLQEFYDQDTATFSYILSDPKTASAAIIDSVLSYDPASGKTSTARADQLIQAVKDQHLTLQWILETHIHADHLTAAHYIKDQVGGKIGVGSRITEVLAHWVPFFETQQDTPLDASQFDVLFDDGAVFELGSLAIKVFHTPGHTPACVSYYVADEAVFVGDLLFMPDVGTGRCDFPGGSAESQYASLVRLFSLPPQTRVYTGHDYPQNREPRSWSTLQEQRENNLLLKDDFSPHIFINRRRERDQGKPVPKLLLPSLQVNLRAGDLGAPSRTGTRFIKIPLDAL